MIYVDEVQTLPFNGKLKKFRHMIADSSRDLAIMAKRLKLLPERIQNKGTVEEHYDLFGVKIHQILLYKQEVILLDSKEFIKRIQKKRDHDGLLQEVVK